MTSIQIEQFEKSFGQTTAVNKVSLAIKKGELFGLIGPDGAGKTTLIRAICTLILPDKGKILVNDLDVTHNVAAVRAILGYMPQRFSLYQDLTVAQNLKFFADLFQVPPREQQERLAELYHFSRLEPFKNRMAGALSGGMKQKLALSCALIHTPDILVLDEPTFGVDPVSRDEFWQILHTIRKRGTTILVSTAYMDEANQCDRVALFFDGRIQAMDTPANLRDSFPYPLFEVHAGDLNKAINFFRTIDTVHGIQKFGDTLHISLTELPGASQWQTWQKECTGQISSWEQTKPSIEDIFLDQMESSHE